MGEDGHDKKMKLGGEKETWRKFFIFGFYFH